MKITRAAGEKLSLIHPGNYILKVILDNSNAGGIRAHFEKHIKWSTCISSQILMATYKQASLYRNYFLVS